jgi:ribosome maturation factor RimP
VGGRDVTGRVVAVEDDGVVLDVADDRVEVPWQDLGRGKVQVEFTRAGADDEEG